MEFNFCPLGNCYPHRQLSLLFKGQVDTYVYVLITAAMGLRRPSLTGSVITSSGGRHGYQCGYKNLPESWANSVGAVAVQSADLKPRYICISVNGDVGIKICLEKITWICNNLLPDKNERPHSLRGGAKRWAPLTLSDQTHAVLGSNHNIEELCFSKRPWAKPQSLLPSLLPPFIFFFN